MIVNKYYVFAPQRIEVEETKDNQMISGKEAERQALVKQAQKASEIKN
ncbi:hypothetical protein [Vibrio ponticus]|nr:hypothetical protein [Vibrio ponticus]